MQAGSGDAVRPIAQRQCLAKGGDRRSCLRQRIDRRRPLRPVQMMTRRRAIVAHPAEMMRERECMVDAALAGQRGQRLRDGAVDQLAAGCQQRAIGDHLDRGMAQGHCSSASARASAMP